MPRVFGRLDNKSYCRVTGDAKDHRFKQSSTIHGVAAETDMKLETMEAISLSAGPEAISLSPDR